MRNFSYVNTYTSNCCTTGDMGWTDLSGAIKNNIFLIKFRNWSTKIKLIAELETQCYIQRYCYISH